jgi:hypothetical protein
MRAYMRVLGGEETDLEIIPHDAPVVIVEVPMFGHLILKTEGTAEPGVRLQPATVKEALLARGPGLGEKVYDVKNVDNRWEIEMLHKADRLCVVIEHD